MKVRIEAFCSGGGYVPTPANYVQPDAPPQNIVALCEFAGKYGKYPMRLKGGNHE